MARGSSDGCRMPFGCLLCQDGRPYGRHTQKSGSAIVKGVLAYGEMVGTPGLNLLSAPGNDLVASTALAASGAHIVLFTTGRGTPFACPVPTMKISSNSRLAGKKDNWIDFNAGVVAEGESLDDAGQRLFDEVVAVASGKEVKSELAGFHDMAIYKQSTVSTCRTATDH